mgnify:CR=1 FL=1
MPQHRPNSPSPPGPGPPTSPPGYISRLPPPVEESQVLPVLRALQGAAKPVIYYGGGCLDAQAELREFAARTGIPLASTFMGLGVVPSTDPNVRIVLMGRGGVHGGAREAKKGGLRIGVGGRMNWAGRQRVGEGACLPPELALWRKGSTVVGASSGDRVERKPAVGGLSRSQEAHNTRVVVWGVGRGGPLCRSCQRGRKGIWWVLDVARSEDKR